MHVMPPTSPSVNAAEQWNSLSSAAERRKVQNRISQRLHRKKMKARREEAEFASRHAETSSLESMKQIWRDTPSLDNSQKQIENTTQANSHTCSEMPSIVNIGGNQQSAFNQSIAKYGLQLPLFQPALQDQTDQTPSLSYADFSLSPDPSTSFQELLMRREHVPQTRCPNCGVISEVNSLDGSHPKEKLKSKRDNNPDISNATVNNWGGDSQFFEHSMDMAGQTTITNDMTIIPAAKDPKRPAVTQKAGNAKTWTTSIHITVKQGHVRLLKLLLDNGADVNTTDSNGSTALHLAAQAGNEEIVRLLLLNYADRELLDGSGWMAVHRAAESGSETVLRLLLTPCHGVPP